MLSKFLLIPILFIVVTFSLDQEKAKERIFLEVEKVVDGDTFWIINQVGEREKIRLIGVDTPEMRRTRSKEIGYYGKEASEYVKNLLSEKKVRLEFDVSKYDRYRRTLAYVYLEDGTFLNAHLVKMGYATLMTVPPNVKFADLFLELQQKARKKERGLWKEPSLIPEK
jgi:micrococcal nuclease